MKRSVHFPPQDMKSPLIHLFNSLATRLQVVTEAQQLDTLAQDPESGVEDIPFWWQQQQVCKASGDKGAWTGF